jgi:uncharacterized protein with GYD domain
MPHFIRLVKLTERAYRDPKKMSQLQEEAGNILKNKGIKLVDAYATLGRYDVVAVIEAPDIDTATEASLLIASKTGATAETLPATDLADFFARFA